MTKPAWMHKDFRYAPSSQAALAAREKISQVSNEGPQGYYARSASDKTDDYPRWMVCKDGLNVGWRDKFGPKFATRAECEAEAARLNALTENTA
jgi:hypothetical protein